VGFSLSELEDSYEPIPAGHAIANNGRTHNGRTVSKPLTVAAIQDI
jgi:hypothetical protein